MPSLLYLGPSLPLFTHFWRRNSAKSLGEWAIDVAGHPVTVHLKALGRHNAVNAAGALAIKDGDAPAAVIAKAFDGMRARLA